MYTECHSPISPDIVDLTNTFSNESFFESKLHEAESNARNPVEASECPILARFEESLTAIHARLQAIEQDITYILSLPEQEIATLVYAEGSTVLVDQVEEEKNAVNILEHQAREAMYLNGVDLVRVIGYVLVFGEIGNKLGKMEKGLWAVMTDHMNRESIKRALRMNYGEELLDSLVVSHCRTRSLDREF